MQQKQATQKQVFVTGVWPLSTHADPTSTNNCDIPRMAWSHQLADLSDFGLLGEQS